jgi:hypothetical protein
MASICRQRIEGGTKKLPYCNREIFRIPATNWCHCAGDVSREVPKNVRQCRRDVSRVAALKGVSVQAKCRRWHTKVCQCPREDNRVLAKFGDYVLANC